MLPRLLRLPREAYENRDKILAAIAVFFLALSLRQNEKIARLEARPEVREEIHREQEKQISRGPRKTTTTTTKAPDGTVTKTKVEEVASEDISSRKGEDTARVEAPPRLDDRSHRFRAGARLDPYAPKRLEAWAPVVGITLGNRLDISYSKTIGGGLESGHGVEFAFRFGR